MEDIIDLIATGSAASDVSDEIKRILYAKAAERIDIARPIVSQDMFGDQTFNDQETEDEEADYSEEDSEEDQE